MTIDSVTDTGTDTDTDTEKLLDKQQRQGFGDHRGLVLPLGLDGVFQGHQDPAVSLLRHLQDLEAGADLAPHRHGV